MIGKAGCSRGPCPGRAAGGAAPACRRRAVEDRRARLVERLLHRKRELRDLGESAQPRELRSQLEILGDEALILALEEETDLPERLDVAFVRERHHDAAQLIITAIRGKRKLRERGRRERHPPDQRAAIEKEIELADGERHRARRLVPPQRREAPALQALHIETQARAVEVQHLRADPIAADEQKDVAAQGIPRQALGDHPAQAVEAFAHVRRGAVRVHGHAPPGPSHRSRATNCAAVSTSTPSTRTPVGVDDHHERAAIRRGVGDHVDRTEPRDPATQRRRLTGAMPSAVATARTPSPAASRVRQYATACWRSPPNTDARPPGDPRALDRACRRNRCTASSIRLLLAGRL